MVFICTDISSITDAALEIVNKSGIHKGTNLFLNKEDIEDLKTWFNFMLYFHVLNISIIFFALIGSFTQMLQAKGDLMFCG